MHLMKFLSAGVDKKVEQGSRLVIGHGGNFGMTPMAIHETHQIDISDKWLSWGWENKKRKQNNTCKKL